MKAAYGIYPFIQRIRGPVLADGIELFEIERGIRGLENREWQFE